MCKYNPNYNLCFPSYPKIQFGPLKQNIKSNKEDILETVNTEEDNYLIENSNFNHHNSHNFNLNNDKILSKHNTTNVHHITNENNITNQNVSHPLNNANILTNNQNEDSISNEKDKKTGKNIFSRKHIPYSEKNNAPNFIKYTGRNLSGNKSIDKNNNNIYIVEKLNTTESQRKNTINTEKTHSNKISKKKSKIIVNSSKNNM